MTILFALTLVPMIGLTGLAIDYSLRMRAKTALDASTDAAVLAAATEAMQIIQTQSTATYDATEAAKAYGQTAGQQIFTANSATVGTISPPVLKLNLQRDGLLINATGSYSAQVPTVFGKMFGTTALGLGGQAASSLNMPKYLNIYVATDISQSMGIGASQDDMTRLAALTGGCVFGCHVKQTGQKISNEEVAHNNKIQLRIDVIKQAIQSMISSAKNLANNNSPTVSLGLYTLQEQIPADNTNYYNVLSSPTTDYATLTTITDKIELGNNDSGGTGDTNFAGSVSAFASKEVTASGDGSSTSSGQNFVFLLTDGVSDTKGSSCTYGHCTGPLDYRLCDAIKAKATVGVIYTTYTPFPNEDAYRRLVQSFQPTIATNLQKCASNGWYYEASDGPDIQTAMNNLFAQAVSTGKLTK